MSRDQLSPLVVQALFCVHVCDVRCMLAAYPLWHGPPSSSTAFPSAVMQAKQQPFRHPAAADRGGVARHASREQGGHACSERLCDAFALRHAGSSSGSFESGGCFQFATGQLTLASSAIILCWPGCLVWLYHSIAIILVLPAHLSCVVPFNTPQHY